MVVLWRRWIFLSSFRFVCVFLLRYFVSLCLSLSFIDPPIAPPNRFSPVSLSL